MNCFKIVLLLIFLVHISCNTNEASKANIVKYFDDAIEDSLNPNWYTHQVAHPDRLQIVKDPINNNNDVLKVSLNVGDKVAKGYRSEIIIKPKDSFGYCNSYSFKFMFPESFFVVEKEGVGRILLNQWHNVPYPGYNYTDQIVKVRVPFAFMVEHFPDGKFHLVMHYGLKVGTMNEMEFGVWPEEIEPNVWYTFENDIFWSLYEDGYAIPRVNSIPFKVDKKSSPIFQGANMYHVLPHDYKMGVYWNGVQQNSRYVLFDEFYMNTQRTGYFK